MKKWLLLSMLLMAMMGPVTAPSSCFARAIFFHATKRAMARAIKARGFSLFKMRSKARFGKGVYLSAARKAALKEKKAADAIVRVRLSKRFRARSLNMTKPSPPKVRAIMRVRDLRGATKKGVIGPKLGKRLGKYAGRHDRTIRYRSSKYRGGVNYFVPKSVLKRHPKSVRASSIISLGHQR